MLLWLGTQLFKMTLNLSNKFSGFINFTDHSFQSYELYWENSPFFVPLLRVKFNFIFIFKYKLAVFEQIFVKLS